MSRLNPAANVVQALGGVRATARIVDCSPGAVSRWMMTRDKRGTEGRVPQKHWEKILRHARSNKVKVTLKDLAGL
jgi:hypothetical protein